MNRHPITCRRGIKCVVHTAPLAIQPERKKTRKNMVTFASNLETIHLVENLFETSENAVEEYSASSMVGATSQLTDEIKILSSEHGRARRYLREIPKEYLKAAVKYGMKTKVGKDQKTGLPAGNILAEILSTSRTTLVRRKSLATKNLSQLRQLPFPPKGWINIIMFNE